MGVFHAKGWWPKSSGPPSKVCLPWVSKGGICDVLEFLPGCSGPLAVFKKFVQKKMCSFFVPYESRENKPITSFEARRWLEVNFPSQGKSYISPQAIKNSIFHNPFISWEDWRLGGKGQAIFKGKFIPQKDIFQRMVLRVRKGVRLPKERGPTSRKVRADLRGTSGEVWETSGEPWIAVNSTVRELLGKSPKSFRGSLGNFWGSPGTLQKLGGA